MCIYFFSFLENCCDFLVLVDLFINFHENACMHMNQIETCLINFLYFETKSFIPIESVSQFYFKLLWDCKACMCIF